MSKYVIYSAYYDQDETTGARAQYHGIADDFGSACEKMDKLYERMTAIAEDISDLDDYESLDCEVEKGGGDRYKSTCVYLNGESSRDLLVMIIPAPDKPYLLASMHIETCLNGSTPEPTAIRGYDTFEEAREAMVHEYTEKMNNKDEYYTYDPGYSELGFYSAECAIETMDYQYNLNILCEGNGFKSNEIIYI